MSRQICGGLLCTSARCYQGRRYLQYCLGLGHVINECDCEATAAAFPLILMRATCPSMFAIILSEAGWPVEVGSLFAYSVFGLEFAGYLEVYMLYYSEIYCNLTLLYTTRDPKTDAPNSPF